MNGVRAPRLLPQVLRFARRLLEAKTIISIPRVGPRAKMACARYPSLLYLYFEPLQCDILYNSYVTLSLNQNVYLFFIVTGSSRMEPNIRDMRCGRPEFCTSSTHTVTLHAIVEL